MKTVRYEKEFTLYAPASQSSANSYADWLANISDRGWRLLIDFRNWPKWIPAMESVAQLNQESPARGSLLAIHQHSRQLTASIDLWDPPRSLQFSIDLEGCEIAYGFILQAKQEDTGFQVTLELERSLGGLSRFFPFPQAWRLRRMGERLGAAMAAELQAEV